MKIRDEEDLDRLAKVYTDGPVYDVLMELKRMRDDRDSEVDPARRAYLDNEISGWAGGLHELVNIVESDR